MCVKQYIHIVFNGVHHIELYKKEFLNEMEKNYELNFIRLEKISIQLVLMKKFENLIRIKSDSVKCPIFNLKY